jgi:hypothetical protein
MLIAAVAFSQIAVAAYACERLPGMPTAMQQAAGGFATNSTSARSPSPSGVHAGHEPMGAAAPGLCIGHCQFGNQSADHASVSPVPAALPNALYALSPTDPAGGPHRSRPPAATQGSPPADPPHAILHCCLRD